jgi:hypothetical protein
MPRDASSEPDSARSPLSLRGSWGLVAAGLLLVVSGAALGPGDASATGQWRKRQLYAYSKPQVANKASPPIGSSD